MSKIKLPNLHKGVTKISEDIIVMSDYIYIKDYHAIVLNNGCIIVTDLKLLLELQKDPDVEIDNNLEEILNIFDYLDCKFITPLFWNELVQATSMIMVEKIPEHIKITSKGIEKELFHINPVFSEPQDEEIFLNEILNPLKDYCIKQTFGVGVSTIPINFVVVLKSMFGSLVAKDTLIIEHHGDDQLMRFTFNKNRNIFGLIVNDYDSCRELFLSLSLENFIKGEREEAPNLTSLKDMDVIAETVNKEESKNIDGFISESIGVPSNVLRKEVPVFEFNKDTNETNKVNKD